MIYKLLSGTRRAAALGSLAVVTLLALGVGSYVGYGAWQRVMHARAGRAEFTIPTFLTLNPGTSDPNIVSLRADSLHLQVAAVDPSAQAFFIAAAILTAAAVLFAVATVVLLCYRLIRDAPFGGGSAWLVALSGVIAVAAGIVGPILEGTAKQIAVSQLQGVPSIESPIMPGDLAYYASSSFELMPVCVGLAALLIAAVFRSGDVLDRDAKGLV